VLSDHKKHVYFRCEWDNRKVLYVQSSTELYTLLISVLKLIRSAWGDLSFRQWQLLCVCVWGRERWGRIGGDKREDHVDPAPCWDTNPSLWLVKTPPHGRAQCVHTRANPHATPVRLRNGREWEGETIWVNNLIFTRRSRPRCQYIFSPHFPDRLKSHTHTHTHTHTGERERETAWWDSWYRGPWGEQNESLSFLLAVIRMRSLPCAKGLSLLGDHKMPPERFIFHSQNPLQPSSHIQEMIG